MVTIPTVIPSAATHRYRAPGRTLTDDAMSDKLLELFVRHRLVATRIRQTRTCVRGKAVDIL
jgi:hypothetical protein